MDDYLEAEVIEETVVPLSIEIEQERDSEGKFTGKRLTRKQAAFVKELIDNPKQSATEAAAKTYNIKSRRNTAEVIAYENLRKPQIIMALGESAELFESAIVGVVRDWKDAETPRKREIALDAAKFGHDKIFGRATTKIESQTSVVQIAINLTGDGEEPPEELLQAT